MAPRTHAILLILFGLGLGVMATGASSGTVHNSPVPDLPVLAVVGGLLALTGAFAVFLDLLRSAL